jgi:hypothetical protein
LCDSHLIPAAALKLLRDDSLRNPNPVIIGETTAYTSSKQISDYLLCKSCEDRFRERGETWVLENCYRPEGTFFIREALETHKPVINNGEIIIYEGSKIREIDCQQLIYLGMSVFWRAAAHSWRWQGDRLQIDLGPYLEPIRQFLLDNAPFPKKTALTVRVSAAKEDFPNLAVLPQSTKKKGYHIHSFIIPGLAFFMAVGGGVPESMIQLSTAPAAENYLGMNLKTESEELGAMSVAAQSVRAPKGF